MKASFFRTFRRKDTKQSSSTDSDRDSFASQSVAKDPGRSFWLDDHDRRSTTASPMRAWSTIHSPSPSPGPFLKTLSPSKRPAVNPSGEKAKSANSIPSRPPRPAPLYTAPHGSDSTPTLLSPKRPEVTEQGVLNPLRSPRLARSRDERGVPQLDGIWDDFLTDLNEDRARLESNAPAISSQRQRQLMGDDSLTRPRADSLKTKTKPDNPVTPRIRRVGSQPQLHRDVDMSEPELPPLPKLTAGHDPLALFPAPPPLKVKKKAPTLVLRTAPVLPPIPPSPSLSFSSESTFTLDSALVTPTTPAFRSSSGKIPAPILRSRRSKDLLSEPRKPPMTSLPSTPDQESLVFPSVSPSPEMQRSQRMFASKISHSVSQVYPKNSSNLKVHRPTSSDSTSSAESRKLFKPFLPPTRTSYQVHSLLLMAKHS